MTWSIAETRTNSQDTNCSTEASKDETGCEEEVADMNAKVEELTL